jgi:hypothetical protein
MTRVYDFSNEKKNKEENQNTIQVIFSKGYPSLSSTYNTILEKTVKAIIRYIEGKTHLIIGEIKLELLIDEAGWVWLLGCDQLHFYSWNGELDRFMDKEMIHHDTKIFKRNFRCSGRYCDFYGETNFFEDGDQEIGLRVI